MITKAQRRAKGTKREAREVGVGWEAMTAAGRGFDVAQPNGVPMGSNVGRHGFDVIDSTELAEVSAQRTPAAG